MLEPLNTPEWTQIFADPTVSSRIKPEDVREIIAITLPDHEGHEESGCSAFGQSLVGFLRLSNGSYAAVRGWCTGEVLDCHIAGALDLVLQGGFCPRDRISLDMATQEDLEIADYSDA